MIRINLENISNFEYIKQCHLKYFKEIIEDELSNLWIEEGLYIKKRKKRNHDGYKTYYKLNNKQIAEIEIFFGGKFSEYNCKTRFEISSDKKIESLVADGLEDIILNFSGYKIDETLLNRIFNYEKFCKNEDWNRHKLINQLGVNVCPYCNRQYITNYECKESNTKKTTADLDHFYAKKFYPYLALSLYNLIPSCQICNSRFKLDKDFSSNRHIYPYEEEFGEECKFIIESDSLSYLWEDNNEFEIKLKNTSIDNLEKINNSIKTFKLEEVYKIHKDYVIEIIKKSIIYNEDRINDIFKSYPEMFDSEEDVRQTIMGNYLIDEKLGNRPLAKLTKDILEEWDI